MNTSQDDVPGIRVVPRAVRMTAKLYPSINREAMKRMVEEFVADPNPAANNLKWNLAQNYYVARCFGIDPSLRLFSRDVLGDAEIYLDTNVVIPAIAPDARHHQAVQFLNRARERLNIRFLVAQITIDELNRVVDAHRSILPRTVMQVPEGTVSKVRGVFFQMYHDACGQNANPEFAEVFSDFLDPLTRLRESYGVERIDDSWFDEETATAETQALAAKLRMNSSSRIGRKTARAALHDALLLRWVSGEMSRAEHPVMIVTLDGRLPAARVNGDGVQHAVAVTLDALLQWLSPATASGDADELTMRVFSDAVRNQLLPTDTFFDITDFEIFAEMSMECRLLPAADVEGCLKALARAGRHVDLNDARGREQLQRVARRYFVSPDREYQKNVDRLSAEAETAREAARLVQNEFEARTAELDARLKRARDAHAADARELREEIDTLREHGDAERREAVVRLKCAWLWATTALAAMIASTALLIVSFSYGDGDNNWQKVASFWPWFTGVWAIALFVAKAVPAALGWRDRPGAPT